MWEAPSRSGGLLIWRIISLSGVPEKALEEGSDFRPASQRLMGRGLWPSRNPAQPPACPPLAAATPGHSRTKSRALCQAGKGRGAQTAWRP